MNGWMGWDTPNKGGALHEAENQTVLYYAALFCFDYQWQHVASILCSKPPLCHHLLRLHGRFLPPQPPARRKHLNHLLPYANKTYHPFI